MGYSEDDPIVRVDFFKHEGRAESASKKWYCTEAVKWVGGFDSPVLIDAYRQSLTDHLRKEDGGGRLCGMLAVCLEPHHEHAYPVAVIIKQEWFWEEG